MTFSKSHWILKSYWNPLLSRLVFGRFVHTNIVRLVGSYVHHTRETQLRNSRSGENQTCRSNTSIIQNSPDLQMLLRHMHYQLYPIFMHKIWSKAHFLHSYQKRERKWIREEILNFMVSEKRTCVDSAYSRYPLASWWKKRAYGRASWLSVLWILNLQVRKGHLNKKSESWFYHT